MSNCVDSRISACWLFVITSHFALSISFRMPDISLRMSEDVFFVAETTSFAEVFSEFSKPEDLIKCFVSLLTFFEISSYVPSSLSIFSADRFSNGKSDSIISTSISAVSSFCFFEFLGGTLLRIG